MHKDENLIHREGAESPLGRQKRQGEFATDEHG